MNIPTFQYSTYRKKKHFILRNKNKTVGYAVSVRTVHELEYRIKKVFTLWQEFDIVSETYECDWMNKCITPCHSRTSLI